MAFPRVMQEYAYVLPNELPELPLHQEVELAIETIPDTSPIALPIYYMVPVELAEMQTQIGELMRLGFIRRSMFPWEAPPLFDKI